MVVPNVCGAIRGPCVVCSTKHFDKLEASLKHPSTIEEYQALLQQKDHEISDLNSRLSNWPPNNATAEPEGGPILEAPETPEKSFIMQRWISEQEEKAAASPFITREKEDGMRNSDESIEIDQWGTVQMGSRPALTTVEEGDGSDRPSRSNSRASNQSEADTTSQRPSKKEKLRAEIAELSDKLTRAEAKNERLKERLTANKSELNHTNQSLETQVSSQQCGSV